MNKYVRKFTVAAVMLALEGELDDLLVAEVGHEPFRRLVR